MCLPSSSFTPFIFTVSGCASATSPRRQVPSIAHQNKNSAAHAFSASRSPSSPTRVAQVAFILFLCARIFSSTGPNTIMLSEESFDDPEPPEDCTCLDDADDDDAIDNGNIADEEFVELDPSGRYGRYAEVLGKGATKMVFKAYDMVDCKEVAWNKAKAKMHAEGPDEEALAIEREIILLQRLKFKGIMKLYNAWVDESSGDTNFITELCSSTLLAFCLKHKYVSRKAVKSWARQILEGLVHLHTQDPPIIHRDLKCENIFVKSNSSTTLKIGDFGSATILNGTKRMHTVVGTPEFMAPEMFQEDYNELVDVYSFGMCMLELLTRECPYAECTSLAQVYKQVISGRKPKCLLKVKDVEALQFISRCLLPACERPSAKELLNDPFLQQKEVSANLMPSLRGLTTSVPGKLLFGDCNSSKAAMLCEFNEEITDGSTATDLKGNTTDCVCKDNACIAKDSTSRRSYQVVGTKEGEYTLQLRIRIQESSHCSSIMFPFDLRSDTPTSVAEEMVCTLDYPQSDLLTIADLISEQLAVLASIVEGGMDAPTCVKNSECAMLRQQQTDHLADSASKEEFCASSSASSILDASFGLPISSEPFNDLALSVSAGELRCGKLASNSTASHSDEKTDSSLVKHRGALQGKSSNIAAHSRRLGLFVFKNSLNFRLLPLPKFLWRLPSEEENRRQHPVYVNPVA